MRVLLKRNWYTSHGRFRPGPNDEAVDIPDSLRDELPSDAVEVDEDGNPVDKKKAAAEAKKKAAADKKAAAKK